jgi:hypothetical protein
MIQHAPKKDPPATKPRPDSEDELLQEGLEETFPASDPPSSVRPHRHQNHQNNQRPVWDQYPETD